MKKLFSLTLALLMALSLAACAPKAAPTPDPAESVNALIAYALKGDGSGLAKVYGFTDADEAAAALAPDADLRAALAESLLAALSEDLLPSARSVEKLTQSILDLLGRMDFSCKTVSRDGDTAVVRVSMSTLSPDALTDALTEYAAPRLMENLDKLTDTAAVLELTFDIMSGYFDQLKPSGSVDFELSFTLTRVQLEDRELSVWGTADEGDALGEGVITAIFGEGLSL